MSDSRSSDSRHSDSRNSDSHNLASDHAAITRRFFLRLGAAGTAALPLLSWTASAADAVDPALAEAIGKLHFLTDPEAFGTVERGTPLPYTHPPEKLREVGLVRETWKLEVISDPDAPSKLESPLSKDAGTALDWDGLMKLAEKHAVRFLKVMTCNNGGSPLGMGLWEGVPLRTIVWLTKPVSDVRRVFYYGYHNDDPKQRFQSSLPVGRVLEDPPGEHPVIVAYKLNGEFLSGKRGGPVRMVVPEMYGFKSVKWLQRVVLTNAPYANDTYANGNNDVDSWMKTFARFLSHPGKAKVGQSVPLTGLAQVGMSGLKKVQYWLHPQDAPLPKDDPYFTTADWKDAEILSPPKSWGGGIPEGKLPGDVLGFDSAGEPQAWPLRYTAVHWAALLRDIPAGKYHLRCRTIDANGVAQPMPRPFAKSGRNGIEKVDLTIASD
jgi:DMSO/TMAO reductase YedYZ molybdopterin-dependent catalytic subunit